LIGLLKFFVSLRHTFQGGIEMSCESEVLSGNDQFWAQLYSDNFATLCHKATRQLTKGNSYEAEDAVSEAFTRVMRYVQDPESIQNSFAYLWTAVRRVWSAQQARLNASLTDRLEDMSDESLEGLAALRVEPEVLGELAKEDSLRELRVKLGPLSLQEETMVKRRLEGYSLQEIAAEFGEDVKRTRFRWYRFTARQRNRLNRGKPKDQASQGLDEAS
jgi:RNA polymerase sigma factor (sigma-70 family)